MVQHLDTVVDTHLLKGLGNQSEEDNQVGRSIQIEDSPDLKLAVDIREAADSREVADIQEAAENLPAESLVADIHNSVADLYTKIIFTKHFNCQASNNK